MSPALCSPFSGIQGTDTPAAAVAVAPSPGTKGTGKRHKVTACALAIMGLQQSPEEQGTAKEIMAAIEADSALAQHLNWWDMHSTRVQSALTLCLLEMVKSFSRQSVPGLLCMLKAFGPQT